MPTEGTQIVPPKRKITLSDDVREAFTERLKHSQACAERAEEDFLIDVYLMNLSGMTIAEIAEALGQKTSTVGDWKRKGEEARSRRGGIDSDGRAERLANS